MTNKETLKISEETFNVVLPSEELSGFHFDYSNVYTESDNQDFMKNINREVVSEFLKSDHTKVYVTKDESGNYKLIAHNNISNETIKVSGIGDHFVAYMETMSLAEKKQQLRKSHQDYKPLLTHEFIQATNEKILHFREGEVGIGQYRSVDYWGRELRVCISKINKETGKRERIKCVDLERSLNGNIEKKMTELINWANNEAFQSDEKYMTDISKFTADFMRIHPFNDGNSRTSRLLINYISHIHGKPLINIPHERVEEYDLCLQYANAKSTEDFINENSTYAQFAYEMFKKYGERNEDNKYMPFTDFLKSCTIKHSKEYISKIINYGSISPCDKFQADQIGLKPIENMPNA